MGEFEKRMNDFKTYGVSEDDKELRRLIKRQRVKELINNAKKEFPIHKKYFVIERGETSYSTCEISKLEVETYRKKGREVKEVTLIDNEKGIEWFVRWFGE